MISLLCAYYCTYLSLLALVFFTVITFLEVSGNEYLKHRFSGYDGESRVATLLGVLVLNGVVALVGFGYIRNQQNIENETAKEDDGA